MMKGTPFCGVRQFIEAMERATDIDASSIRTNLGENAAGLNCRLNAYAQQVAAAILNRASCQSFRRGRRRLLLAETRTFATARRHQCAALMAALAGRPSSRCPAKAWP